jgi:hypothetical protein
MVPPLKKYPKTIDFSRVTMSGGEIVNLACSEHAAFSGIMTLLKLWCTQGSFLGSRLGMYLRQMESRRQSIFLLA